MTHRTRADALVRITLGLADGTLRGSYLATLLRDWPVESVARTLDAVCERAEQAETGAREALISIVDALNMDGMTDLVQRLREEAAAGSLLALERLIRHPISAALPTAAGAGPERAPSVGRGRELTLGERKSLARRPDRELMQRLLLDPHPDVIGRCLRNPRIVEDDVVRLAAKRPGRPEVLVEIARSRWSLRPRVRIALVLNPATPQEMALRIAGLLVRPELELVASTPVASPSLRAVCREHLERRPPVDGARRTGEGRSALH
jgi:hypothetical protein